METNLYEAVRPKEVAPISAPEQESALAREQYSMFMRAYHAGHKDWMATSAKNDAFYRGEQWEAGLKAQLEAEGRPALTINLILSTVNVILGEQITSRLDIQYKARKDADEKTAFAITKLVSGIMAANAYRWVESSVFADGVIQDRGYFDIRMDWSKTAEGQAKIVALDPSNVIPDPDAKDADPATWKEWFYTRWVSLEDIEVEFGDEIAKKIDSLATQGDTYGPDSIKTEDNTFGNRTELSNTSQFYTPGTRKIIKCIRLIERQFRKSIRIYYLIDPATGVRKALPADTTKTEAEKLGKMYNALVQGVTEQRIRWRVTADRFVLHDSWSPYKSFTVVPFFPYFRRGKPFGVVTNLISPQEQFNKLASQELHIVNSTANSGWIVEQGALHGMTSDDLSQQGSKTGLVITVNPGKLGGIDKIQPNSIPTGIDRISAKSQGNIQYISGVNSSMLGTETAEVSGVAMEKKQGVGAVQLAVVKDSGEKTQYWVARKMLELVQDFMGYEQIVKYTEQTPAEPREQTKEIVVNQVQPNGSVANDLTVGEYDYAITTLPSRDTFNETQFAEVLALREVGVQIPDYRVVQFSNLEQKHEIAEEVKQLSGLGDVPPEVQEQQRRAQEAQVALEEAKAVKENALGQQAASQAELNMAKATAAAADTELRQRELEMQYSLEVEGFDVRKALSDAQTLTKLAGVHQAKQAAAQKMALDLHNIQSKERIATTSAVNKLDQAVLQHQLNPPKPKGTSND